MSGLLSPTIATIWQKKEFYKYNCNKVANIFGIINKFLLNWDKIKREYFTPIPHRLGENKKKLFILIHTDWDKIRETKLLQFHTDWEKIFLQN